MVVKRPALSFESIRINKKSTVPVYQQIADGIRALLIKGIFPAGYPLPAERILCEAYGVSRMTLRQATAMLDREGLIISERGRGTFVAHMRLRKQQYQLRSFTEEICARGGKPSSRLISLDLIEPEPEVREFFGLDAEQRVYQLCRLRLSTDVPLAVEEVQLPQWICPSLERFDFEKKSLYAVLEKSYGLILESCTEEISAELPSAKHRQLLALPKAAAVLVIHRKTFSNTGQPLEITRAVYRGDLYSAVVHSMRSKKSRA